MRAAAQIAILIFLSTACATTAAITGKTDKLCDYSRVSPAELRELRDGANGITHGAYITVLERNQDCIEALKKEAAAKKKGDSFFVDLKQYSFGMVIGLIFGLII